MTAQSRGSILIVDDEENWRIVLKRLLGEHYEVQTASSYEEGNRIIQDAPFDLVMLDVRLVDEDIFNVDGLALAERIRDYQPDASVVILTGYPDSIRNETLQGYNVDDVVFKATSGFDTPAFIAQIRGLMDSVL